MGSFEKKTWKNRISEYPTRRILTKEDGSTELVTVSRAEGNISQEGDAFSEDNMNDLEDRVEEAFGRFQVLTAEEYQAVDPDPDTFYFIKES